jgi:hypothetical protein
MWTGPIHPQSHPSTEYQLIAVYRDTDKDGHWILDQVRGPFSKIVSGYLVTALSKTDGTKDLYDEVKSAAMDVFMVLNNEGIQAVKGAWTGTVYDY